jgi:hypothetical protein
MVIITLLLFHARARGREKVKGERKLKMACDGKSERRQGNGCLQSENLGGPPVFNESILAKRGLFLIAKGKVKLWCFAWCWLFCAVIISNGKILFRSRNHDGFFYLDIFLLVLWVIDVENFIALNGQLW